MGRDKRDDAHAATKTKPLVRDRRGGARHHRKQKKKKIAISSYFYVLDFENEMV
jgi:hypothetical protein